MKRRKIPCFHCRWRNFQRRFSQRERDKDGVLPLLCFVQISHHKRRYMVYWEWCFKSHVRIQGHNLQPKREIVCMHDIIGIQFHILNPRSWIHVLPAEFGRCTTSGGHPLFLVLKKKLLFASILEDSGFWVIFMENQAYLWLKNRNIDIVVAIGVQEGGISKVPWNIISSMTHHTISPCKLWHRRLGHLHFRELPGLQWMVKGKPSFDFVHDVCKVTPYIFIVLDK